MSEVKKNEDIVGHLADGTEYVFNMDVCDDAAEDALALLWSKEGRTPKYDYTGAIFSMFVSCIDILSNSGWSTEDLVDEVLTHSAAEDNHVCDDCQEKIDTDELVIKETTPAPKNLH